MTMPYETLLKELGADKSQIEKSTTATEQYIILHNHSMTKEIQDLKKQLIEKQSEYDELDEELDSITRSRNTLQSYLKNQQEIIELHTERKSELEFGYNKNMTIMCLLNIFFMVIIIHTLSNAFDELVATTCFIGISSVWIFGIAIVYEIHQKNISISITEKKIKELSSTNETVSTLIDNM
jgi:hypothetical protein